MPRIRLLSMWLCLVTLSIAARPSQAGAFDGCAAQGMGGDAQLNELKNRTGTIAPRSLTVNAVRRLPSPGAVTRNRSTWTAAARALVASWEGSEASVEGTLVAAKEQGLEAANCRRADQLDIHLWLAAAGQSKSQAVVAELTPRWRAVNPAWNATTVGQLALLRTRVRLTGWLLFDEGHPDQVGKSRATLWELHPVTKIEILRAGSWVELAPRLVPPIAKRRRRRRHA